MFCKFFLISSTFNLLKLASFTKILYLFPSTSESTLMLNRSEEELVIISLASFFLFLLFCFTFLCTSWVGLQRLKVQIAPAHCEVLASRSMNHTTPSHSFHQYPLTSALPLFNFLLLPFSKFKLLLPAQGEVLASRV